MLWSHNPILKPLRLASHQEVAFAPERKMNSPSFSIIQVSPSLPGPTLPIGATIGKVQRAAIWLPTQSTNSSPRKVGPILSTHIEHAFTRLGGRKLSRVTRAHPDTHSARTRTSGAEAISSIINPLSLWAFFLFSWICMKKSRPWKSIPLPGVLTPDGTLVGSSTRKKKMCWMTCDSLYALKHEAICPPPTHCF